MTEVNNTYFSIFYYFCCYKTALTVAFRERQQKLEKMNATRRHIEEFQKEQALWRKKKREEMEEENRKIIEFANMQQQREEDRMAKVQENEEKRLQLQNMVLK